MMNFDLGEILGKAVASAGSLSLGETVYLLSLSGTAEAGKVFAAAREVKRKYGKEEVLPRGLIECSNVCAKDCLYCGIRKSNRSCRRYSMSREEILGCINEARARAFPAVAFQAGEIESEDNTAFYEELLAHIRNLGNVEVTLSLGEQSEETYRRWKRSAGDMCLRYLLRIETSDRDLFASIHPGECSFDRRVECIRTLKRLGYVTGSGVMIGLEGQSDESLARDVVFFGKEKLDMVGMGPYIPHPATPLFSSGVSSPLPATLEKALMMIAVTRLYLHDVNIVAATALEALDPERGREAGIAAGANVIMPNLTPEKYRREYDLYPGKNEV